MSGISITTTNLIMKLIIFVWLLSVVRSIAIMFCAPLFKKASKGAKTASYPVLNLFGMLEVVELSPFLGILLFMPGFNLIVLFLMSLKLGKIFNASFGMKMGLIFLDIVFYPMLAKSNVAYKITNDDYMRALDSARNESINLMTQDEINEMNKVEEPDPFSEVDSIFKSEIKEEFSSEPYKAVKNTQSDNKPAETIAYVDDLFRPIERTEDFETVKTDENQPEQPQNMFTEELNREEKVEYFDL